MSLPVMPGGFFYGTVFNILKAEPTVAYPIVYTSLLISNSP